MTTSYGITYLPRSSKELKELTSRLRDELNEHYSFAPKSNARLEEVVLGTLGITNGRQQWQELIKAEQGESANMSMSLFINITEDSEGDVDNEVPHLEVILDDKSVKRIKRIQEFAEELGTDMVIRDLEFKDPPSDTIEALVTDTGFICFSYEKRVRKAWPITVGQASELSVKQMINAYDLARSMKGEGAACPALFLPRYSKYVYVMPSAWNANEEFQERTLDALDTSDDDEAYEYFQWMSDAMCGTDGEVFRKENAATAGVTGPASSIYDLLVIYRDWLFKQEFFVSESESFQRSIYRSIAIVKNAILNGDDIEMTQRMKEHLTETRFGLDWGLHPEITEEILSKMEDLTEYLAEYRKANKE